MSGIDDLLAQARRADFPIALHLPDGRTLASAEAAPRFAIRVHREAGTRALESLAELGLAESYVRGDFDVLGDFVRALSLLRAAFDDSNLWLKTWRRAEAVLRGREKMNPEWIAKHYDSGNIQLFGQDRDYHIYTPGLYESDDESMEAGAERKLAAAFTGLGLKAGDELLEVGCGWGGFTRFASRRGVRVTGITLSKDREAISAAHGIEAWRLLRILSAGTAAAMDSPDHGTTAYRMFLELPADALQG